MEFSDTGIIHRKANISSREASSSINKVNSDSLLYYATPNVIYNDSGEVVQSGLYGHHSAAQGALFLRHPDNDSIIHLFTSDQVNSKLELGLYHHILTESGTLLCKNDTLLYHRTEQLSSVNHNNNRDVWLAVHKSLSDSFYFYLLQQDGIIDCPVIYASGLSYADFWAEGTILKFSPGGRMLAGCLLYASKLELYKFNSELGQITSQIVLDNQYNIYSTEFGPGENLIYISTTGIPSLVQYDISNFSKQDIIGSKQVLSSQLDAVGCVQLGIDGKIYIARRDSGFLSVIQDPNIRGAGCHFEEKGLNLEFGRSRHGLPNFNQSSFYFPAVDFSYRENCHTLEYRFEANDTIGATSFTWKFISPNGSKRNSRSGKTITYPFVDTGRWTVQLIASNGTQTDTAEKAITIRPQWENDFLGADTFYCEGSQQSFVLKTPPDMHCVHWMGDPSFGQSDSFVAYSPGEYFVKVTNKSFCTTYDTITITSVPYPAKPNLTRRSDTLFCDADPGIFQWYRNNVLIEGEEKNRLVLRQNGTYHVVVSKYGCSVESNEMVIDNVSVNDIAGYGVKVYPNPASKIVCVDLSESNMRLKMVRLYNHQGELVLSQSCSQTNTSYTLHVDGLVPGSYILEMEFNRNTIQETVLIE